jgi:hypothetical protein
MCPKIRLAILPCIGLSVFLAHSTRPTEPVSNAVNTEPSVNKEAISDLATIDSSSNAAEDNRTEVRNTAAFPSSLRYASCLAVAVASRTQHNSKTAPDIT